ncbi:nucleotidyl transferase AbiEii/AbiGii toxin family protein [Sphingobacterium sp. MYb388]|uniref:nucleotidyl transferase AbiEii/AbiGii toxin family protein n=1 Tax=Sphingobacterium sp. MYb388 TaxID=2745437 RepID=UPI0030A4FE9D
MSKFISREEIEKIKRIVLRAIALDDMLSETLILKGGNAISLVYGLSDRPSYDLDFSIEDDFEDFEEVKLLLIHSLETELSSEGYKIIDFAFDFKPHKGNVQPFWGGYNISFKVIDLNTFNEIGQDLEVARRAHVFRLNEKNNSSKFEIEISRSEYFEGCTKQHEIEDEAKILVYLPELLVAEKVRALCQSLPYYRTEILGNERSITKARSRDLYDIDIILSSFNIDINSPEFISILKKVFDIKKVPYEYVKKMDDIKDILKNDFESVKMTITDPDVKDFDHYYDKYLERFYNIFDV